MKTAPWLLGIAALVLFPSAARAPHMGLLDRAPLEVTLVGGNNNSGDTALTVTVISGLRATQQVHVATAGAGSQATLAIPIGSNVKRVVLDVTPPKGGSATLRIFSNGNLTEEPTDVDTRFVYDIRP